MTTKTGRISERVSENVYETLSRAADLVGSTVNQFLVQSALERAHAVIEEESIIGFFVDAKSQAAREYYMQFGFIVLPNNPLELFLPLHSIKSAMEAVEG